MSETRRTTSAVNDGDLPVSHVVLETVADATARDVTELEPLFDVVDPDALDDLVEPEPVNEGRNPLTISFRYAGCRVSVRRDGKVIATPEAEL